MSYAEVIATNPSRLVVLFQRGDDGQENFQWGVVGKMPVLTMIGYIARVQADLTSGAWVPCCDNPQPALVIAWDEADKSAEYFVHPDIPAHAMCGMLELVKQMLVGSRMGQHSASQRVELLGPGGTPWRG